ncbi:MAG: Stp1/IreP family PP2C-type Ser/Thr phosphatase [Terriglobia bacterium]|jgi:protein phosphatase|nr:Stp1/IreP family PP2C-type Ser/Thr phosphatase [Terriglobia bacterium]
MSLTVEVAGKTDVGRVRANNEDNFGFDKRYGIYVVCDGMGGAAAGEVASKMAVDCLLSYFRRAGKDGKVDIVGAYPSEFSMRAIALGSAINLANQEIFNASRASEEHAGMGSTIVAVAANDNEFSIANVGDSRIYRIRENSIQQLTEDHSLVMEQVRRGLITAEEAKRVDYQNIVIRALGAEPTVQADIEDLTAEVGDVIVMCSDGLTRYLDGEKILAIVRESTALEYAVDKLIVTARDAGGADNITVLALKFQEQGWLKGLFNGGPVSREAH